MYNFLFGCIDFISDKNNNFVLGKKFLSDNDYCPNLNSFLKTDSDIFQLSMSLLPYKLKIRIYLTLSSFKIKLIWILLEFSHVLFAYSYYHHMAQKPNLECLIINQLVMNVRSLVGSLCYF
jgi:hypothetical protein